jgi:hypothetical protein
LAVRHIDLGSVVARGNNSLEIGSAGAYETAKLKKVVERGNSCEGGGMGAGGRKTFSFRMSTSTTIRSRGSEEECAARMIIIFRNNYARYFFDSPDLSFIPLPCRDPPSLPQQLISNFLAALHAALSTADEYKKKTLHNNQKLVVKFYLNCAYRNNRRIIETETQSGVFGDFPPGTPVISLSHPYGTRDTF